MTKLFLKIHFVFRTILLLICGIGAFIMMGSDTTWVKICGYICLGLMAVIMYYDRRASAIEKYEKKEREEAFKNKQKLSTKKYPFSNSKAGYVLKWAYYNENIAGCRYLNIPYNELETGKPLTLVKDESNSHDKNAIKVMYGNIHLGYIHKNNIQEMFNKYSEQEDYVIEVRLNSIDEVNKKLQLEIGFYQKFDLNKFSINQFVRFVPVNTLAGQKEWENIRLNDYVEVEFGDTGVVTKDGKYLGELKVIDYKKLSVLSADFRIVYKVVAILGNKEKNNLSARIDAFIINN
jgi:hypothetical protein